MMAMRTDAIAIVCFALAFSMVSGAAGPASFYDLKTQTLLGKPAHLGDYRGKVTLVVNVASYCGYTPQYKGLEAHLRCDVSDVLEGGNAVRQGPVAGVFVSGDERPFTRLELRKVRGRQER